MYFSSSFEIRDRREIGQQAEGEEEGQEVFRIGVIFECFQDEGNTDRK